MYVGVETAACFKWLQDGDLLRSPVNVFSSSLCFYLSSLSAPGHPWPILARHCPPPAARVKVHPNIALSMVVLCGYFGGNMFQMGNSHVAICSGALQPCHVWTQDGLRDPASRPAAGTENPPRPGDPDLLEAAHALVAGPGKAQLPAAVVAAPVEPRKNGALKTGS